MVDWNWRFYHFAGGAAGNFFNHQKQARAEEGARLYQQALFALQDQSLDAATKLDAVIEGPSKGYASLAQLNKAALIAGDGDTVAAHNIFKSVYSNQNYNKNVRDLARLRAGYISLDVGGLEAVTADLAALPSEDTPFGAYGRELIAIAQMSDKDFDSAIAGFEALLSSDRTPPQVRQRTDQFIVLARAAKIRCQSYRGGSG